jgi:queuine tRNA-ribosyltransferase
MPQYKPVSAQNKEKRYLMIARVTPSNLYYYQELMAGLRGAIEAGKLTEFIAVFEAEQAAGDLEPI